MNVISLYEALNKRIPPSLSCDFDNDGVMCCPNPEREVRRVLIALDINEKVITHAIKAHADVIISHHPMLLFGAKSVAYNDFAGRRIINLIKNDISAFSFHTRLDAVEGGVSDGMCALLNLENCESIGKIDGSAGFLARVGTLAEPVALEAFVCRVKDAFGANTVEYADAGNSVRKVAVAGGSGKDFISEAINAGADTFVTGEVGYHNINDAVDFGLNIIAAGHFQTENHICGTIARMVREIDGDINIEMISSLERQTI